MKQGEGSSTCMKNFPTSRDWFWSTIPPMQRSRQATHSTHTSFIPRHIFLYFKWNYGFDLSRNLFRFVSSVNIIIVSNKLLAINGLLLVSATLKQLPSVCFDRKFLVFAMVYIKCPNPTAALFGFCPMF